MPHEVRFNLPRFNANATNTNGAELPAFCQMPVERLNKSILYDQRSKRMISLTGLRVTGPKLPIG
jgi:hypothetical protein